MAVFEAPCWAPGFAWPTDAGGDLGFGQEGCRIDAVEALRDVNLQRLWWPTPDRVAEGFAGIPAGASWAKARGLRRQLGLPGGFQGLAHERLPRPFLWGRDTSRAFVRPAAFGDPRASPRRGLASEPEGVSKGQALGWREGLHPIDTCRVFPTVILGHPTHREPPCLP